MAALPEWGASSRPTAQPAAVNPLRRVPARAARCGAELCRLDSLPFFNTYPLIPVRTMMLLLRFGSTDCPITLSTISSNSSSKLEQKLGIGYGTVPNSSGDAVRAKRRRDLMLDDEVLLRVTYSHGFSHASASVIELVTVHSFSFALIVAPCS